MSNLTDAIRQRAELRRKGGPGSGWYGPPKGTHGPGSQGDTGVPTFGNTSEAERWVETQGLAERAYFRGFDLATTQEICEALAAHRKNAPDLRLSAIGNNRQMNAETRNQMTPQPEHRMAADAFAESIGDAVFINYKYGHNRIFFEGSLREAVNKNWHPPGCDTVKSVVDHELGHVVVRQMGTRAGPFLVNVGRNRRGWGYPSQYAKHNDSEYVAEAWSQFLNDPNPGSAAQNVGALMLEALGGGQ